MMLTNFERTTQSEIKKSHYLEFKTFFIPYDDEVSFFENLNFSNAPSR